MSAQRLKGLGWRQGAVLSPDLVAQVLKDENSGEERLIVISHDCDVTNASLKKEPTVELLVARPVSPDDSRGGNYTWGKNQRTYQLTLTESSNDRPYRIEVHERMTVNRELLVGQAPDSEASISQNDIRGLAHWMAKRYRRSALPDEFNVRRVPANTRIKNALKVGGDPISSLRLAIENVEKESSETYTIKILAVMCVEKYQDADFRLAAELALNELSAALDACDGIHVDDASVLSEARISVDDLRYLQLLDEFDNHSIRQDPVGDLSEH